MSKRSVFISLSLQIKEKLFELYKIIFLQYPILLKFNFNNIISCYISYNTFYDKQNHHYIFNNYQINWC
jgi:hypothetical protein